jgi:hypothetical protein
VSVPDLEPAIEAFMQAWNQNPRPFIWSATVKDIIKKIDRARVKMEEIKPGSTMVGEISLPDLSRPDMIISWCARGAKRLSAAQIQCNRPVFINQSDHLA